MTSCLISLFRLGYKIELLKGNGVMNFMVFDFANTPTMPCLPILCLVVLLFSSIPQCTNSPVAIEYQAAVATLMHKKGFEVNIHSPYSKCFCCDTQTFTKGQWEIQDSGSTCVVRTRANLLPTWIMIEQADIGALRHRASAAAWDRIPK